MNRILKKKNMFSISLQNRLVITYALFISIALAALAITINIFTGLIFNALVKTNITEKNAEIVRSICDQYNPMSRSFDAVTIEAMGMYFVHEGYIVTVKDQDGNPVWDARSCDMQECTMVINDITQRMEKNFGLLGTMRMDQYPVQYAGKNVGTVNIETYGPFFYTKTEIAFLSSINRLLFFAAIMLIIASFAVSIMLSRTIARPINMSAEAARRIAQHHSANASASLPVMRIKDNYHTRELNELAHSINDLSSELEEARRRQKQLTCDIAHELRTPLACLQGGIEAMIDGVYAPDMEHLESCHEEVVRLTALVHDLNTLTNLEWEHIDLHKTEFDLASLLRITSEQFRSAAVKKNIALNLDLVESPIYADYDRIKQVFINLLSNAVKYTDRGSITVSIKDGGSPPRAPAPLCGSSAAPPAEASTPHGGTGLEFSKSKFPLLGSHLQPDFSAMLPRRQWEITVADTGIGIPENDLPHIFERFYRTDKSRNRSSGGAGIGLTIAAAIVAAHGGNITAESSNAGSVFKVLLNPLP